MFCFLVNSITAFWFEALHNIVDTECSEVSDVLEVRANSFFTRLVKYFFIHKGIVSLNKE